MEPVNTLAAGAIVQLAFNEFIKSSAGEAAKKLTGEALTKANDLRRAIWAKFKGSGRAETALAEVEKEGTPEALGKVTKLLDAEMSFEPEFATKIRQLAQQIINIENTSGDLTYHQNAGRDIFNIDNAGQANKFGGS
jgi:hypothetical protein